MLSALAGEPNKGEVGAEGTVTLGRHNLSEMDEDDWRTQLAVLVEERLQQRLQQLKRLQTVLGLSS